MTTTPRRTLFAVACLVVAAIFAAACSGGDDDSEIGCSGGIVDVTVTLPMFAEFACEVGGDNVTVQSLMPLEADPHSYVPPESESELVTRARLVLYAGLELDAPLRDYIFEHGRGSAQLIAYTRSITSPTTTQPPSDQPKIDAERAGDNPYLWLDPQIAKEYVDITRDSLEIVDPENITDYRATTDAYILRLTDLLEELTQDLQVIPAENRKLVTLHDSMFHLARRFGFEVTGFLTVPGETPGQVEIDALVAKVQESGVPAIFTEVGYDPAFMQQVADAADVELCALYTDRADANASTYEEIMKANADELVRCLSGT